MKTSSILLFASCLFITLSSCKKDNTVYLFNGKNLDNWTKVLVDSSADLDDVFQVEDGVIKISGNPFGYMRTNESYSNYSLHVEWRWPQEPTNSGLFLVKVKRLV